MHRTEGSNFVLDANDNAVFTDGPPGTTVTDNWLNSVQEEVANVIEQTGTALLTRATDTNDQLYDAIVALNNVTTPIATMTMWPTSSIPSGWLECDGSAVSRTTYSNLFAKIGIIYGNGDGTTTFNLPDFRGQFIRGHDDGAGVDPDAGTRTDRGDGVTGDNVGTKEAEDFLAHTHNVEGKSDVTQASRFSIKAAVTGTTFLPTSSTGGNETRPVNIYTKFIIKY